MTQIFEAEFQKSLAEVNLLFGVAAIVLGWANFIIVPCANVFGRRPVIIVCCLICFLANIWQALVTSFPSFLGARVISGLGAAANESIMPMVVADLLFVHQRGRSMALYFWAYFLGIFIGPIIAGSIAAQVTWRWFFWLCAILQAASLIFIIVLHPETKYERENNNNNNTAMAAASKSIANHSASAPVEARASSSGSENDTKREEAGVATQPTLTTEPKKTLGGVASPRGSSQSQHSSATNTTHGGPFPARIVGKPSKAQLSLIPRPQFAHGLRNVLRDVVSPLQIFSFPIILWAAFTFGFACNCLLALNLTEAQVFGPPPYLFNPAQIGYTNFAFFVGAAIALLTAGPLSDWIALRSARRNGGVLEAEMRLITVVPYVCCCLVGMVVTAVGYQRGWPWEVVVVVGYGLVGIEVVGVPAVVISYAVDSYKSLPGEIMIAATVVKNTFGVSNTNLPVLPFFLPFSSFFSLKLKANFGKLVRHGLLLQRLGCPPGLHCSCAHHHGCRGWAICDWPGGLHSLWQEIP